MHLTQVSAGLFNSKWPTSNWLNGKTIHTGRGNFPLCTLPFTANPHATKNLSEILEHASDSIAYLEEKSWMPIFAARFILKNLEELATICTKL